MKKTIFFLFAFLCALSASAKTIYLKTGGNDLWGAASPAFFVHAWGGSVEFEDVKLSSVSGDIFSATVDDGTTTVIFLRQNPSTTKVVWEKKEDGSGMWNRTGDETIPAGKDCFTITGWGDYEGAYSTGMWGNYVDPATVEYYLAGEGFPGASWKDGEHMKMTDNAVSFKGLPQGTYRFKVTNNTWDFFLGYDDVNAACSTKDAYSKDDDGNIVVMLASEGDITILVENGKICVTVVGETSKPYTGAVPSECGDVMLQGFYYDSYEVDTAHWGTELYGDTKWKTLLPQVGEIGAYFDLIWLPPSGYASGVGYHPKQYSNQNSDWGSRAELEKLIAAFHNSDTKVIADIVINHTEAMASWCDFAVQDFGEYGRFEVDGSYICKNDEMNWEVNNKDTLAGECYNTATGPNDDGANWDAARDWAHDSPKVQELMKAYLKWMRNVMKYDGWRYDKGDGFNNWHMDNYNKASEPYIAFEERFDGYAPNVRRGIEEANMNMMALDFPAKFDAINPIAGWNYVGRRGLIGNDGNGSDYWKKHSVTWVDNHDMFMRKDNTDEFGGRGKSLTPELKYRVLGANAFILSMPGVPCVFYPHWYVYKEELKAMIDARHLAGVHSESAVENEQWDWDGTRNTGYQATVVGHNGWLILCLGTKANKQGFENYKLMASGYNMFDGKINESYEIWVHALGDVAPGLIVTPNAFFEDLEKGIDVTAKAAGPNSDKAVIYYMTETENAKSDWTQYTTTLNFKETTTLYVKAVCGTAESKVQTYTYTYREPLKRGIQVRFNKPAEWNKVYYYAWIPGKDAQGNVTAENLMGAYPGQRIYQDVDGWFTYEFPYGMDSVNFCINSGSDCGDINVRSNDLVTDYDVCYGWENGKEEESSMEIKLECDVDLKPAFDLVISPESGFFRDEALGQQVTITSIGIEGAMIYYTTDGKEPSTSSQNGPSPITFTVNKTTTVKAYAVHDKDRTATRTETYTYKAPQSGPMTVKFIKPEKWEDLYLYAFTRVKAGTKFKDTPYALVEGKSAKWPGMKWETKEGQWYTHTMREVIPEGIDFYVIFTEGNNKPQTQDIYLTENTCYLWSDYCSKAVVDSNCDGEMDEAIENVETEIPTFDASQPMYNILGQRVGASYFGIVIQNGHKYLILK